MRTVKFILCAGELWHSMQVVVVRGGKTKWRESRVVITAGWSEVAHTAPVPVVVGRI